MAMGIPLITNSGVGDVKEIVMRYHSGIVLEEFTDAALGSAVDAIVNGQIFDAAGIRQGAKEFYSLQSAIEKYNKIYNAILAAPNPRATSHPGGPPK